MSQAFETGADATAELRARIEELEKETAQLKQSRDAIAEREQRYESIVNNQTEIICRIDASLSLTFVNRMFCEYFNESEEQLLGRDYVMFLEPALRDRARAKMKSLFQKPEVTSHVCEVVRTEGQSGWQHGFVTPVMNADDSVYELQVVARVRSSREQAEYEIKNTEIVNGQLAKIMKDGLIVVDPQGIVRSVNEQLCQIGGTKMDEVIGRSMWDIVGAENHEILAEQFAKRSIGGASQYEMPWTSGTGRHVSAIFSPTPLFDAQGRFDGSLSVVTDITARRETEIQLRESERLLAASQKIARVGSFEWKRGEKTVTWSAELYRMHGRSPETFVPTKESFLETVHPDDRVAVRDRLRQIFRGVPSTPHEYRIIRADGEVRWLESTRWLLKDDKGKARGMIGTSRDITSQKRAKMILEERESILRSFYESGLMLMGVVELDGDDIRWISENEATAQHLGTTPEAMRNKTAREIGISPAESALWVSKYQEAEQTGETVRFEYMRPDDPSQRWLSGTVKMIGKSPEKRPRFSYIYDDITDRKRVEAKIQAAHDALEQRVQERTAELVDANRQLRFHAQLLDSVRESVVATDLDGRIVYWGKGAENLYGYQSDEVVGKPITQVARSDGSQGELRRMAQVREMGSWHGEFRQHRTDDTKFWAETVISLVNDPNGNPTGFIAIDRDITVRRRAEERTRQLHADLAHVLRLGTMGEMASGLAHEINQPLGTIANNAHAVARSLRNGTLPNDEVLEIIEEIAAEAMRAGEILHSLHRFASKAEPNRTAVDLRDLVHEVTRLFDSDIRRHGIVLRLDLEENLPEVYVERIQIQQVVVNLVRNAFDALLEDRRSEREVIVRARAVETGVLVSIADNGKNLSPDLYAKIFSPYFTTKKNGMGMGLSICRSIVGSHGSQLRASPNVDCGLTFTFTLPYNATESAPDKSGV